MQTAGQAVLKGTWWEVSVSKLLWRPRKWSMCGWVKKAFCCRGKARSCGDASSSNKGLSAQTAHVVIKDCRQSLNGINTTGVPVFTTFVSDTPPVAAISQGPAIVVSCSSPQEPATQLAPCDHPLPSGNDCCSVLSLIHLFARLLSCSWSFKKLRSLTSLQLAS